MKRLRVCVSAGLALCAILLTGCPANTRPPAKRSFEVMGTFATISLSAALAGRLDEADTVTREVFNDLDRRLSLFKPDSELSLLNRAAGQADVPLSGQAVEVLRLALHYAKISGGAFDPTVSPLLPLWGFQGAPLPDGVPAPEALETALGRIGYQYVALSELHSDSPGSEARPATGRLTRPGMRLDLGGIAKGFAVDVAFERLVRLGITDLMIDLGGNIRCAGSPRNGGAWKVGVRNPFDTEDLLGTLRMTGGMAVATSGNYEQFVEIDGTRYAHIIDPRTGRPVRGMAGVTVISVTAVEADAMSTALFVTGLQHSADLLRKTPHAEALLVPDRQPVEFWITKRFLEHFRVSPRFADNMRVIDNAVP